MDEDLGFADCAVSYSLLTVPSAAPHLKILIVSEMSVPHATGGGESRYGLLSRQLAADGHDVTWLSMRQRQSGEEETIDGVRHLHRGPRILSPPTRPLLAKLHFMVSLILHLLTHRYEVVDCQTYAPLPAAWLACWLRRMPLVGTIHDTSTSMPGKGDADQWLSGFDRQLASRVERSLYRLGYTRVLTVSPAVQADLVGRMGVRASRVSVVPNAIDFERINGVAPCPDPTDLVFVGRMVPHKHPEALLEATAMLNQRRTAAGRHPLRVRMIGAGPLAAAVQATALKLGLQANLDLRGEVESHDEVVSCIKAARVLVLPSTREGFGLVLTEAMACGTAVAAYGVPAVVETMGPALQHCLAEPGNVGQLAQVIESFVDNESLRQTAIERGRERVMSAFGGRRFVDGVLDVYRQAARARTVGVCRGADRR